MWFVFQRSIYSNFQQQLPVFILSLSLASLSPDFSKITSLSSLRNETYTLGLSQSLHHVSLATVIGSGMSMRLKSVTELLGKPICSCFLKGWKNWSTTVGNLITEVTQKAELKEEKQPSIGELFSLNPAMSMLEAWNLHLGFPITRDNKFPFKPVWIRFSATCNRKNPTYFQCHSLSRRRTVSVH